MRISNQSAGVIRTAFTKNLYPDVSAVNSGRILPQIQIAVDNAYSLWWIRLLLDLGVETPFPIRFGTEDRDLIPLFPSESLGVNRLTFSQRARGITGYVHSLYSNQFK